MGPPVPITARMHITPQHPRADAMRYTLMADQSDARSSCAGLLCRICLIPRDVTLLDYTGRPVPITARVLSTPQSSQHETLRSVR
eukprot:9476641-Pyramimonas_sp.AAC.3